uniref:OB domain-containing protein n=1 Tax=Heterorhabditis bacteriophora TaxID=37862 RepID=A0A1I7X7M1_HETBA
MAVIHPVHGHGHPPPQQIDPYIKVAQLQPQMNGVNIYVIVLDAGQLRRTATGGAIQVMRVADPTGSVNMTIMNPEVADMFQAGDIVKIKNAFTNIHRGGLTLSCGRMGEFVKSGEFFMLYSEVPNLSEYNPEWAAIERARKPSPPEEGEVCLILFSSTLGTKRVMNKFSCNHYGFFC